MATGTRALGCFIGESFIRGPPEWVRYSGLECSEKHFVWQCTGYNWPQVHADARATVHAIAFSAAQTADSSTMNVRDYLNRTGPASPARPALAALRPIHRAPLLSIPYENLDVQLGRPVGLSPAP